MLKLIFWLLLLANTVLFVFRMGYLGSLTSSKSESDRLAKQLNADKIKLVASPPKALPTAGPPAASAVATSATTTGQTASSPRVVATPPPPNPGAAPSAKLTPCTEVGEFSEEKAKQFEVRLAKLIRDDHMVRQIRQKVATYMVHIPPQGSKAAADKKAQELRDLGVTNFFIIKDSARMRWGISLGVFKSEVLAKKHLANLRKKGVRSARIVARSVGEKRVIFILRDMASKQLQALDKVMTHFPEQKRRECGKP
jgi:hypothetical protein